ncbi:RNA polymerase sigma factor RpoD [Gemmatimonadetes bacterium T265]|nr:RNA polymerase sigma factor RpoD [Gemmatimonadetes bacterium T265]
MQRVTAAPRARPALHPTAAPGGTSFDQYLSDIQRLPLIPTVEEERRLARLARNGDADAAERLVTANLRFVISYVKRYQGRGLDLADLVAIGNEGLLKAVRKFDPDQGVKFISYAVWWVRQAVLKALAEQTRAVRVPLNQNTALIRAGRAHAILAQRLGRDPTDDELGELLGEPADTVRQSRQLSAPEIALDAPVDRGAREAGTFGERIADDDASAIEDALSDRLVHEHLEHALQHYLTPRERRILILYYGLEPGSEEMTLERIGDVMGVTRERIRQIRERAFAKLRESADGPALSDYWTAA